MPTPHLRTAVVLTPEQTALLDRLGALQGQSRASYLRRLVDVATPSLARLAARLESVEAVHVELDHTVADAIEAMQEEEDDQLDLVYDTVLAADLEATGGGAGRSLRPATATVDPRKVTRGSEPTRGRKASPKAVSRKGTR